MVKLNHWGKQQRRAKKVAAKWRSMLSFVSRDGGVKPGMALASAVWWEVLETLSQWCKEKYAFHIILNKLVGGTTPADPSTVPQTLVCWTALCLWAIFTNIPFKPLSHKPRHWWETPGKHNPALREVLGLCLAGCWWRGSTAGTAPSGASPRPPLVAIWPRHCP